MPVLLAYVIEDSTDIFRISGWGGVEHTKPPLSARHCRCVLNNSVHKMSVTFYIMYEISNMMYVMSTVYSDTVTYIRNKEDLGRVVGRIRHSDVIITAQLHMTLCTGTRAPNR